MKTSRIVAIVCGLIWGASVVAADWETGTAAFKAGRFEAAEAEFRTVVERSPEAPQGYYMLGLSRLRQGRVADALGPLERAVELAPEPSYLLVLAQTQLEADRPGDALRTLASGDPSALPDKLRRGYGQLLAAAALAVDEPAEAAPLLRRFLDAERGVKEPWLALAHVASLSNRATEARDALVAAFGLDPTDGDVAGQAVRATFRVAKSREGQERQATYREALTVTRRWLEAVPSSIEARLMAGEALMGAGDYSEAVPWLEEAATLGAEALPRYYLARCRLALGDAEAALDDAEDALERTSDADLTRLARTTRGAALHRLERFDEAAAAYRLAGDEAKAREMEHWAEVKRTNDASRAQCESRRAELESLMKDSRDLEGTEPWKVLEREYEALLVSCAAFFPASSS